MTKQTATRVSPDALHARVLAAYAGLGYPHNIVGSWAISDNDVADFVNIVTEQQPKNILEVGTFVGVSTLLMALACPRARIFTVDPDFPLEVEMGSMQSDTAGSDASITTHGLARRAADVLGVGDRIQFVKGGFAVTDTFSSATLVDGEVTALVGPKLCAEHGPFDFIFVDGLHTAKAVAADLELAAKWLTPDGTIALHDCIGFWGANVRAGVSEFLRANLDYRFTYPQFSLLYKSVGIVRRRTLPRLKREKIRSSLADCGVGVMTQDMLRSAMRLVTDKPTLELWVNSQMVSGRRRAPNKDFEGLRLPLASDPGLEQEAVVQSLEAKLNRRGLGAVFSAELADYASDAAFAALLQHIKSRHLPLVLAFTPPGEALVAGPLSRPLAAIVDSVEAAGLYVHAFPARHQEAARYELLPEPRELGTSSLFSALLLIGANEHVVSTEGDVLVRLTRELAAELEQQQLQRVHLAAAIRHYLEKDREAADLTHRLQARAAEVDEKAIADAEQLRGDITALRREVDETHRQHQAARAHIEDFTTAKLALDLATSRLLCESETLRLSHINLKEKNETLQREHIALRTECESLNQTHAALTAELSALRAAYDEKNRADEALRQESQRAESHAQNLHNQLQQKQAHAEKLEAALSVARSTADSQFFSLVEAYAALEQIAATVGVGRPAGENGAQPCVAEAVEEIRAAVQVILEENEQLKYDVSALQGSTSWRVTAPIRAAVIRLRGLRPN